jgi:predicted membrane metal-binding protein
MGWLFALAPIVGRIAHPWHVLRLAAVAYVAWQPTALLFEPSFALSFLATIGVMVWGSWLDERLEARVPSDVLREAVTSTFGATLLTTPYTMWAFGQASALGAACAMGDGARVYSPGSPGCSDRSIRQRFHKNYIIYC